MEREGREVRRRGGGEMRKGIRGIIVGGMILSLLIACNNGVADLEKKNQFLSSVVTLGNEFLNVFTSFGDIIGGVLGLNADTKKSDVGAYFKTVQDTVQGTKDKLNKIVIDMKNESNPNVVNAEVAANKLISETLDKIIEGASEALKGAGDNGLIADVASDNIGSAGEENAVKSLTEGIGKIVSVVLEGKGNANAGDNNNPADDTNGTAGSARNDTDDNANNGALALFVKKAINNAGAGKAAKDALKAVGAVTGADILKAISEGISGNAAKLAIHNGSTLSSKNPIASGDAKDATIAGGIVLRAMAKSGKFSNKSGGTAAKQQIQGATISAVSKALNTLTMAIRKTIDEGLKTVKDTININANDTPVINEAKNQ